MEDVASEFPEFVGQPECTINMSNKSPIEFFDLLVTVQMFEEIAEESNLYANHNFEEHPDIAQRSRLHYWTKKAHSSNRIVANFPLIIAMDIIHYPKIEDYCPWYWPFSSTTFSQVMTRDRFSLILKFLHFNNKNNQKKKRRIWIRSII